MIDLLNRIPLTSILAVVFVGVGAILTLAGTLEYGEYLEQSGIALAGLGVIGIARSLNDKG